MPRFAITLIAGWPRREDEHYVDIEGRLVYGERVVSTLPAPVGSTDGQPSVGAAVAAAVEDATSHGATGARPS